LIREVFELGGHETREAQPIPVFEGLTEDRWIELQTPLRVSMGKPELSEHLLRFLPIPFRHGCAKISLAWEMVINARILDTHLLSNATEVDPGVAVQLGRSFSGFQDSLSSILAHVTPSLTECY
jgi:hypothetical protein